MNKYKITDSEINSGVVAAPDILSDTPQENKSVFDRLPKMIANKFNLFLDFVDAMFYSKEEVEEAIDQRVIEIGAGDMAQGIYDKTHNGVVDNAERVNGIWFDFKDENGNPGTDVYMHWLEDENGNPVITPPSFTILLEGDFDVETDGEGRVTIIQEGN